MEDYPLYSGIVLFLCLNAPDVEARNAVSASIMSNVGYPPDSDHPQVQYGGLALHQRTGTASDPKCSSYRPLNSSHAYA